MFLGEYKHNLTTGKRLALPKKIREQITGGKVILAKGFEPCIFGFDRKIWEEITRQELLVPISESKGREIRRRMFSGAQEIDIDIQGRVVLPDSLIDWAQIKEEITVVGAGDHFEIWDSEGWKTYLEKIEPKKE